VIALGKDFPVFFQFLVKALVFAAERLEGRDIQLGCKHE